MSNKNDVNDVTVSLLVASKHDGSLVSVGRATFGGPPDRSAGEKPFGKVEMKKSVSSGSADL